MEIREMTREDLSRVIPMYIAYYDGTGDFGWTPENAEERFLQTLTMRGQYSLVMEDSGEITGIALGWLKQYSDCVGYFLDEIIIEPSRQDRGLGSLLLYTLEERVREQGASCVELHSEISDRHENFYRRSGYSDVCNYKLMVKWFGEEN